MKRKPDNPIPPQRAAKYMALGAAAAVVLWRLAEAFGL